MAGTGYTIPAAAKYTGLPVAAIEAAINRGDVRVFKLNGERVINGGGLAFLRGAAEARAEIAGAGRGPGSSSDAEDENDPASWSEETIQAKGKKIAAAIKGQGADSTIPITESIRIRG